MNLNNATVSTYTCPASSVRMISDAGIIALMMVVYCGGKNVHYEHATAGFSIDVPAQWEKAKEDSTTVEFHSPENILLKVTGSIWEPESYEHKFITDYKASNLVREIAIQAKDECCEEAGISKCDIIAVGAVNWGMQPGFGVRIKGYSEKLKNNAIVYTIGAVAKEYNYLFTMSMLCSEDAYKRKQGEIEKIINSLQIREPTQHNVMRKKLNEYGDTIPIIDEPDQKPEPIYLPEPWFPEIARENRFWGMTSVEALVDTDGSVLDAKITDSFYKHNRSPDYATIKALLDTAALESAKQAQFRPAIYQGNPIRVWVSIHYRYSATMDMCKVLYEDTVPTVEYARLDHKPEVNYLPEPEYPDLPEGHEVKFYLNHALLFVDTDGKIIDLALSEWSTKEDKALLDTTVYESARRIQFSRAEHNGAPVRTWVTVDYEIFPFKCRIRFADGDWQEIWY